MQNQSHIPVEKLPDWINAVGILLSTQGQEENRIEQVGQPRVRRRTG